MSIEIKKKEIQDMFDIFDDPMDKYTQIIELGKKNVGIPDEYKIDENRIFGCASMAWVTVTNNNNTYNILIDSDTFIVKGLLSILKYIIDGASLEEINNLKIESIFKDIGLENAITSQRTNGFLNALEKIKEKING
jgi:cysteine desulfuration protein SufE|tara:strand:- start:18650 stop:19057 length:408 start_codon:yes stop_codon:yes gene_type:complete